jgi:hypothetical protein
VVVAIESRNAAFSTTSLAAPAGQVTVVLTNSDLFRHTFTIDELDVNVEAPLGGTREEPSPPHQGPTGSTAGCRPTPRPAWRAP